MTRDLSRLVRAYVWILGAGLLLEGAALLLLASLHVPVPFALDDRHNALHVVWGLVILGALAGSRDPRRLTALAIVFGVFYTGLAFAGVLLVNPFGLVLGPGENIFHFAVGLASVAAAALNEVRSREVLAPVSGSRGRG